MTTLPDANREEQHTAALLRAIGGEVVEPNTATLAKLRQQSLLQFASAAHESESSSSTPLSLPSMRRPMIALALRGISALAVTLLLGLVWLNPWSPSTSVGSVSFGKVVEKLRQAESLHFAVTHGDQQAEVWIRRPGLVRWQETPERYQIAAGSRLWKIDESNNSVVEQDSPWFRDADQQIDLLKLLDLGIDDARPLLQAEATPVRDNRGEDLLVYRSTLGGKQGLLQIDALVNRATNQLTSISARPIGKGAQQNAPLAELRLIAVNEIIADDQFKVAKSLTEDGRIGKIVDAQGVVTIRPLLARRWTPVCQEMIVKPGDWLRIELRGANAAKVTLTSNVELTLGPGSLLECISPNRVRLHSGIVQVVVPKPAEKEAKAAAFELLGPGEEREHMDEGKQIVRVDAKEKFVSVKQAPLWLQGFEGTTHNESLGSLIVNLPDGRNEPLTIGYHKVTVEIRDQIARTTIEESFVNRTDGRLEGTFHFPLPQDASISGFGMWIGGDLVEADIVEKQRAREIYETILREKRDPGLLEWTSGNLFKARVFPIEPRSEKRVKIVYTQVLPLRGNRYRYAYNLRSDLLRKNPVRELSLTVTASSALPLKNATCSTHTVRSQRTAHSARLEFTAQEYSPVRDFEAVFEIDAAQSNVVVVPHRRGNDGYLLVQLTPPATEGALQRELVGDSEPLNLVLLCDTSASMNADKRREQAEFVASVLASLSDKDRFNLAAADVGTTWAFPDSVAATAEHIATAKLMLEQRTSLGWTDLERAFTDALRRAPESSHVIYIGDGIVTAGETDPAAFVKRLARLLHADPAKQSANVERIFHAVTVGNVSEKTVLQGIASAGGGSVRSISGEQTPTTVARELLEELTRPGLTDLHVEFRGVQVAALYPEQLPPLALGTQQILVGRYSPTASDQVGEVIVSGQRGSEKVRYVGKVELSKAAEENSFIPRLWARSHLDFLLQQGQSEAICNQVIALSEEYHIITPYTSLLVLESDADRERFGVKRRYEMRDGERFFAAGQANADYELGQQQMRQARDWRIALRSRVLRQWSTLGRDSQFFQRSDRYRGLPVSGVSSSAPVGATEEFSFFFGAARGDEIERLSVSGFKGAKDKLNEEPWDTVDAANMALPQIIVQEEESLLGLGLGDEALKRERGSQLRDGLYDAVAFDSAPRAAEPGLELAGAFGPMGRMDFRRKNSGLEPASKPAQFGFQISGLGYQPDYQSWLNNLFPHLEPAVTNSAIPEPEDWSAEAIALSKSLSRIESLQQLKGGIELRRVVDTFDVHWKRRDSHNTELMLYALNAWLNRSLNIGGHTLVEYCRDKQRAVFSRPLLLGRSRTAHASDFEKPPLSLQDFSLDLLHQSHWAYQTRVEAAGEKRQLLILRPHVGDSEMRFLIDIDRHVVLSVEMRSEGKFSSRTTFTDFVEIAGSWWARKATIHDADEKLIGETTYEIVELPDDAFSKRFDEELTLLPQVQFMQLPLPRLAKAQQRVLDGSATFDDRLMVMMHFVQLQQWDDALQQLTAIEKEFGKTKPGIRWIRPLLWSTMRRNEEAWQRLVAEARDILAQPSADDVYLAEFIIARSQQVASATEQLELIEMLKPVYVRSAEAEQQLARWQSHLLSAYDAAGRPEQALELRRLMATASPWDQYGQADYARRLVAQGRAGEAFQWMQTQLGRTVPHGSAEEYLRSALVDLYRDQAQWKDLLKFTTAWIAENPSTVGAYQRHLSALIHNDQLDQANALATTWLQEFQQEKELTQPQQARLQTAIAYAKGSTYSLNFHRLDPRWQNSLEQAARFFLAQPKHLNEVQQIFDYRLAETEVGDRLRGHFFATLRDQAASLSGEQLNFLVNACLNGRLQLAAPINGRQQLNAAEIPDSFWEAIAGTLKQRWLKETAVEEKQKLADTLRTIYQARFASTQLLPFLRERIASVPLPQRPVLSNDLFTVLLGSTWSQEVEDESYSLISQLADPKGASDKRAVEVPALYRWVDAMIANRSNRETTKLQDSGEHQKLTRIERGQRLAEIHRQTLKQFADSLNGKIEKSSPELAPWLRMDYAWLLVQLDRNLDKVSEISWVVLGKAPAKHWGDVETEQPLTPAQTSQRFFEELLRHRALTTQLNIASRRDANKEVVDRMDQYISAGTQLAGDDGAYWRKVKADFLVARDLADELETELRAWLRDDDTTAPWRIMLGILLAERGKLSEAITLFEAAEKHQLLSAEHYRMLANWYLVMKRRDAYERARVEAYKQLPENYLANLFYQTTQRWNRTDLPIPSELSEEALLGYRALLEKSAQPEAYLYHLRDLYGATRDFRLLKMLPDATLGRSPGQIYRFLQQLRSILLSEIRNEAPADEILARVQQLREGQLREGQRTATDLRALDLIEALVERRASEVLNQPQPHVAAALAAMKRAFQREFVAGEPVLMAELLRNLGALSQPELSRERERELRSLVEKTKTGTRDHLVITEHLARVLLETSSRGDEALRLMENEVAAYDAANQSQWPFIDNELLSSYVQMLEGANRFNAGEASLKKYLAKPASVAQRDWLQTRMIRLYHLALEHRGETSLGSGETLFINAIDHAVELIRQADNDNTRYSLITYTLPLFDTAHRLQIAGEAKKLRTFAFTTLPELLERQSSNYRNIVNEPVRLLAQSLGAEETLRYIVERMEHYPARYEITWDSSWEVFGHDLSRFREEASRGNNHVEAALENRVFKLAIDELKRDLRSAENRNQYLFHRSYGYFWREKAAKFAQAAEEVYAEEKTSGRRAMRVATYLRTGLGLSSRAIEILLIADRAGVLDENELSQLVDYMHEDRRYAESISILERLIDLQPHVMRHRARLLIAYSHAERGEQWAELYKSTIEHFRQQGRWAEASVAELAAACNTSQQFKHAIELFREVISLHQKANPGSGLGDATLSKWYQQLADAFSGEGNTKEAVDAACAAIVVWSPSHHERKESLEKLQQVLVQAQDLAKFVQVWSTDVAASGQDSPLVRKTLGQVLQKRGEHVAAVEQFREAVALQPNDRETRQALITSYDALHQPEAATKELLQLIDLDAHDLKLFQQLAQRLKDNEAEAERAATSIVEAAPNEAENHAALAEWRQKQNRWDDAIRHWQKVSELRRLEPTGLLHLAEAQIHQQEWPAAKATIEKLQRTEWPARFNDVGAKVLSLQNQLPKK